jgi:hypothetical protein
MLGVVVPHLVHFPRLEYLDLSQNKLLEFSEMRNCHHYHLQQQQQQHETD